MKDRGLSADLIRAAGLRLVGREGLTDTDVGALLGPAGVGAPFRAVVDIRRKLQSGVQVPGIYVSYLSLFDLPCMQILC
jgi:hypothetical protein